MITNKKWLLMALFSLVAATGFSQTASATPDCTNYSNTALVTYPTINPVWEMCVRRPQSSTPSPNGSGVEIFEVTYNGHLVMERGNVPVLNVQYGTGGCGCFRDWMDSEADFEALDPSACSAGICEITDEPQTICDCAPTNSCDANPDNACNTEIGSFRGVAIKRNPTTMSLTSHSRAGWYRYTMQWVFHLDGVIEPKFKFGATPNGCTDASHMHHGYYRFDFDINGAGNDQMSSLLPTLSGADSDVDGIDNDLDNCLAVANPSQKDADGDGFGNVCDADFNNDNIVNFLDLPYFSAAFLSTDPIIDLNGDGVVNFSDLTLFSDMFLTAPGPAGTGGSIAEMLINTETSAFAGADESWQVIDTSSGRGYRVIPGAADHAISNSGGIPNPEDFARADYWVLNENGSEQTDAGFGCATTLNNYVDAESTSDTDIVFWLRFGTHHEGLDECFCGLNGPRLEPIGNWSM